MLDIYTQNAIIEAALDEWITTLLDKTIEESPNEYVRNVYKEVKGCLQLLALKFKEKMSILPIVEFIHDQYFILDKTPEQISSETTIPLKQVKSVIEVLMKPNAIPTYDGEI